MEVKFYELLADNIEKAVPRLLYKIYDQKKSRILFHCKDAIEIEKFDKILWVFSSNKFLPHGKLRDGKEHYQQLLLSSELQNSNDAAILVANDFVPDEFGKLFQQNIYIFHNAQREKFQQKFTELKQQNITSSYWQQDMQGKWQKNG